MYQVSDCTITDCELNKIIDHFVPERDAYYITDDELTFGLLKAGFVVYSFDELKACFPTFAVEYGALYKIWGRPQDTYVVLANGRQLEKMPSELRLRILSQQVELKRGHVYDMAWFEEFSTPIQRNTVMIENKKFYVLTADDWWTFPGELRKRWALKWLKQWNEGDPDGITEYRRGHCAVPYALIDEYAGTYAGTSGPNCFAAAIAAVVGGHRNPEHSHVLIKQWLHAEPFFRLLEAQGYSKMTELHSIRDFSSVRTADVLIWNTREGEPGHAGFAVTDELMFQKHGQGFQDPWRVLKVKDIWYNTYLESGGYIAVYRRTDL